MRLKAWIKRSIPPGLLNGMLLKCPSLYGTPLVRYETNLADSGGIRELLQHLTRVAALDGDVIECGSSRCGASAIMAHLLRRQGLSKTVYAFDSFEGFDTDELQYERERGLTSVTSDAFTSTSYDYVVKKLAALGLSDAVVPVKGFFQDVLVPGALSQTCLALVDCDLQQSTAYCLTTIWPSVVGGGCIVVDDYDSDEFGGVRPAVDQFVRENLPSIGEHGLSGRLYRIYKRDGQASCCQ